MVFHLIVVKCLSQSLQGLGVRRLVSLRGIDELFYQLPLRLLEAVLVGLLVLSEKVSRVVLDA